MKTSGLWAIASALFLIASSLAKSDTLYILALMYAWLSSIRALWD